MRYVPALDGVRCYAVLMVALYHFHNFAAGWIGVQVFFVLSGFLITAILLDAKTRHPENYFRRFYWRRTLRIFPLYFAYFGIAAVSWAIFAAPAAFGELWPWLLTYTSNFSRMGVYDKGTEFFVHFWSLGVEEQFYLIWPITVYLLSIRGLRRLACVLLIAVPLLRLGMGAWLFDMGMGSERVARVVGVFTLSQFDAFAAGALLAVIPLERIRGVLGIAIGALGLWLLAGLFMLATVPNRTPGFGIDSLGHHATTINYYHVWGSTLTNLASAAVILAAMKGYLQPLFANRAVVHVGKVSYGVYVLHLPMHYWLVRFVPFSHSSLAGMTIFWLYFAAVVGVATLSYRFFETPFLRLKERMA